MNYKTIPRSISLILRFSLSLSLSLSLRLKLRFWQSLSRSLTINLPISIFISISISIPAHRGPRITSSQSLWGSLPGTPVTSPSQCPHSPLSERTQRDLPGTPVSLGVTLGSDQSDFAGKLDKFECFRDPGGLGCYHGQRSA